MRHIYTFKNLTNGKIYVGQTNKPKKRLWEHFQAAEKGRDSLLCYAIRKYGKENFVFEVIEDCEDSLANEREEYWISQFDSFENGYNMTTGGDHFHFQMKQRKKLVIDFVANIFLKNINKSFGKSTKAKNLRLILKKHFAKCLSL